MYLMYMVSLGEKQKKEKEKQLWFSAVVCLSLFTYKTVLGVTAHIVRASHCNVL